MVAFLYFPWPFLQILQLNAYSIKEVLTFMRILYQHFINYNNIKTNRIYTAGYNPYNPVQANLDIKIEGTILLKKSQSIVQHLKITHLEVNK